MDITLIYHTITGRIVDMISNQDHEFNLNCISESVEAAILSTTEANGKTHYITNLSTTPVLAARQAPPITRSGLTLSNVPTGSTLFIDGTAYPAQGTVDLSFPLPGTYALRVECFPYLDFVTEVTV